MICKTWTELLDRAMNIGTRAFRHVDMCIPYSMICNL
jgi:hypothetical protein